MSIHLSHLKWTKELLLLSTNQVLFLHRLCLAYWMLAHTLCSCFNIDTRTAVVHTGANGSMFGYAVSVHKDNGFGWLLVGAPKAQSGQPETEYSGAVYRCTVDRSNVCQMIPFDTSGPGKIILRGKKEDMDSKSHQWFGATVHSSGENGVIVACAPRYVYFSSNLKKRDPVGTCWTVKGSFTNFQEYSPCRTLAWGYHRQGSCQAGFSAAVTKDGRQLFVGAVGSWYWQGQLFSQSLLSKQSQYKTPEAPEHDDDSYLGYSMAVGEFTGDRDLDVVVGVPRGSNLVGKIALFNSTLHNLQNVTGDQMGSYFGYSICVTDLNGDGLDDIVVGAPLYSDLHAKAGKYEQGRIFVIYQNKQNRFKIGGYIDGPNTRGRFGLSLAHISDVNNDGFNDLAVGCPYGGKGGKGAVYIYHGSPNGIIKKPAQVLNADKVPNTPSTFGWSISGGLDMDNNEYPDILIGAYEADQVVFLRSRPVVKVTSSLKINPEKISLDDKGCKLGSGTLVSCVVVSFCLEYTGIGIDANMGFKYYTKLDAQSVSPRVYFLTEESNNELNVTINVRKESKYCTSVYAYIQNNVRDKLTPIMVQVLYELDDPYPESNYLKPILDRTISNNLTRQVNIQKNCGKDNICIPDMRLQIVPNMHQFLIGSNKRLILDIVVSNEGEDAFEAMLYGSLPYEVDYVNIAKVRPMDIPVSCSEMQTLEDTVRGRKNLTCDIGNPLPSNTTLTFKILLAPSRLIYEKNSLKFEFTANSTNKELDDRLYDNYLSFTLPVRVEVNVTLHGLSEPRTITYNRTTVLIEQMKNEVDVGPEVIHVYAVGNSGPSTVKEAKIEILWPTYTLEKRPLLYLMDQPEILGNGSCQKINTVNPLHLKKEQRRPMGSYTLGIINLPPLSLERQGVAHIFGKSPKDQHPSEDNNLTTNFEDMSQFADNMSCGPTLCTKITCSVYDLKTNDQVSFTIRSRLWKESLMQMGLEKVQISSKLITEIVSLPQNRDPSYIGKIFHFVTTKVKLEKPGLKLHLIPWWIIILSVSVGLLILGLLALLLWWLGFFRRRRPSCQMEEPLHCPQKNGYHLTNGDEYL